jgi:hypothetical protein
MRRPSGEAGTTTAMVGGRGRRPPAPAAEEEAAESKDIEPPMRARTCTYLLPRRGVAARRCGAHVLLPGGGAQGGARANSGRCTSEPTSVRVTRGASRSVEVCTPTPLIGTACGADLPVVRLIGTACGTGSAQSE